MYVLTYHCNGDPPRQHKLTDPMPPPRYPAIGRRSFASKPVFRVLAQFSGPGTSWKTVLTTADRQYAMMKMEQFREAGLTVRLEEPGDHD